jgi:hypothetical protein
MIEHIQNSWQDLVAGGAVGIALRELVALALRVKAAQMRGDKDPTNDAMADVLDDAAKSVKRQ